MRVEMLLLYSKIAKRHQDLEILLQSDVTSSSFALVIPSTQQWRSIPKMQLKGIKKGVVKLD